MGQSETKSQERAGWGCAIVIIIAIVIGIVFLFKMCSGGNGEVVYNNNWDHGVWQVRSYLRENLKDPQSYDGIEWSDVIKAENGTYMVRHKYRAKNSFGGYVVEEKIFVLSKDGEVMAVLDSDYLDDNY